MYSRSNALEKGKTGSVVEESSVTKRKNNMRLTAGCFGRLLATAMLLHRTYGFAFFKGVATWIHALRNPCKQVAPLCIDRMTGGRELSLRFALTEWQGIICPVSDTRLQKIHIPPVGIFDMSIIPQKAIVKQKIIFFCKLSNKMIAWIVYIL